MSVAVFENLHSSNPFTFIYLKDNFCNFFQLTEETSLGYFIVLYSSLIGKLCKGLAYLEWAREIVSTGKILQTSFATETKTL